MTQSKEKTIRVEVMRQPPHLSERQAHPCLQTAACPVRSEAPIPESVQEGKRPTGLHDLAGGFHCSDSAAQDPAALLWLRLQVPGSSDPDPRLPGLSCGGDAQSGRGHC